MTGRTCTLRVRQPAESSLCASHFGTTTSFNSTALPISICCSVAATPRAFSADRATRISVPGALAAGNQGVAGHSEPPAAVVGTTTPDPRLAAGVLPAAERAAVVGTAEIAAVVGTRVAAAV